MKVKIITQYDPTLPPTEANRKQIIHLSKGLIDDGNDLDIEVIWNPAPWADQTYQIDCAKEVDCPSQVDYPTLPGGIPVLRKSSLRSAIGLLSSGLDLLIIHSTFGWKIFSIMEALRIRHIPHLACIYNSMLYHFWEKRVLGINLRHWYSHIENIGIYCHSQEEILKQVLPDVRTHMLTPITEDFPLRRKPTEHPSLLYIGSFDKKHGANLLLETARWLQEEKPEVSIVMAIRYHSMLDQARSQINKMKLTNIRLLGEVDVWEELSKAWVFLYPFQGTALPSLPLSVIEALKSGTPIVAAKKGGIPEILSPESLFDGTLEDFIEKVHQQLENPSVTPCPDRFLFQNALKIYLETYHSIAEIT